MKTVSCITDQLITYDTMNSRGNHIEQDTTKKFLQMHKKVISLLKVEQSLTYVPTPLRYMAIRRVNYLHSFYLM